MSTATRMQRRENTAESARRKTAPKRAEIEGIKENPIYKTLFEAKLAPEQQIEALEKTLAFLDTETKAKQAVRNMQDVLEFLDLQVEEMHTELIELTDVEVQGFLQGIYDNLNGRMDRWADLIKPLLETLKAIFDLRTNNVTGEAYREIQSDKARKDQLDRLRSDLNGQLKTLEDAILADQREMDRLSEDKSLFGFGPVKKATREIIAVKRGEVDRKMGDLSALQEKIQKLATDDGATSTLSAEMQKAKEGLRNLLETDKAGHRQQQEAIVAETLDLIKVFKEETTQGRDHLARHAKQFDRLKTMNREISEVMVVLEEGTRKAELLSDGERKKLEAAPEGETSVQKIKRESRKRSIEEHMKTLGDVSRDVGQAAADLQNDAVRIRTGKETTDNQANNLRLMSTRGVASLAGQLNATLTAINAASLNESNEMARMALARMNSETQSIMKQEVVRVANEGASLSDDIQRTIENLADFHEVYQDAQADTKEHMKSVRAGLDELKSIRDSFREDVDRSISEQADIGVGATSARKESALADGPFGRGE